MGSGFEIFFAISWSHVGYDGPNLNINVGDRVVTDESDMPEVFNSYFVNVASNLKEPIVPSNL